MTDGMVPKKPNVKIILLTAIAAITLASVYHYYYVTKKSIHKPGRLYRRTKCTPHSKLNRIFHNAETAIELLKPYGITIERAEDGVVCVDMMQKQNAGYYDLILMDIQMPNMDGYKAAQTIRHLDDKQKSTIPIFAMTANAFEEDKKDALDAGMNGHISKPIDAQKLIELLTYVMEK